MKYIFSLILVSVLFISCANEEEYYDKATKAYGDQKFEEAIKNFKVIVSDFPEGKHHAEAMFMVGYISANDMSNYDLAKEYYTMFLDTYPNHELANATRYELETLGKDINELPMFKDALADTTATSAEN